jgi:uncharacterized membrane protein
MKTFISAWLERLRTSYWFIPSLMAVSAAGLSFLTGHLDKLMNVKWARSTGWIWAGGPEGARNVLATIAGSTITVAGVVFSVTIVALTLASSQFGPRLLRNFMDDRGTQVVLGIFVSTFLYCLLVLRTIRGTDVTTFVPFLSVTCGLIFAVASVGFLIYFIHHIPTSILAENVIGRVAGELRSGIDRLYPEEAGSGREPVNGAPELPPRFEDESREILSKTSGYIQAIAVDNLFEITKREDLIFRLAVRPGDFVIAGTLLTEVWPGEKFKDDIVDQVHRNFFFGRQRTPTQDVEYCIGQLVEVAVRALSPGVNDPFTAITCIDWLGAALICLAKRKIPSGERFDDEGRLRLIVEMTDFAGFVASALNQIRQYGNKSVAVIIRMLDMLARIGCEVPRSSNRKVYSRTQIGFATTALPAH